LQLEVVDWKNYAAELNHLKVENPKLKGSFYFRRPFPIFYNLPIEGISIFPHKSTEYNNKTMSFVGEVTSALNN